MKNIFLPFQIGEQYENWEFDLEYLEEEKIQGYDSYIYLWEKTFLHIIPTRIELIFSLDILQVVIMTCEFENLENLNLFKYMMHQKFSERRKIIIKNQEIEILRELDLEIWLQHEITKNNILITYGDFTTIRRVNL